MGQLVFQATLGGQTNLVGANTASTYNLNVPAASDTLVARDTTDTLTNKTIAFSSNTLTDVAGTTATQTLTNKTLTSPAISGPTMTGTIYANGSQKGNVTAMGALDVDCSAGNYFTKTIAGASTFTFSNAPSGSFAFTLELTVTSGSATWPAAVKWPSDTAPTLGTGKTSLLMFVTDDSGTRWRGASLVDYTT